MPAGLHSPTFPWGTRPACAPRVAWGHRHALTSWTTTQGQAECVFSSYVLHCPLEYGVRLHTLKEQKGSVALSSGVLWSLRFGHLLALHRQLMSPLVSCPGLPTRGCNPTTWGPRSSTSPTRGGTLAENAGNETWNVRHAKQLLSYTDFPQGQTNVPPSVVSNMQQVQQWRAERHKRLTELVIPLNANHMHERHPKGYALPSLTGVKQIVRWTMCLW